MSEEVCEKDGLGIKKKASDKAIRSRLSRCMGERGAGVRLGSEKFTACSSLVSNCLRCLWEQQQQMQNFGTTVEGHHLVFSLMVKFHTASSNSKVSLLYLSAKQLLLKKCWYLP